MLTFYRALKLAAAGQQQAAVHHGAVAAGSSWERLLSHSFVSTSSSGLGESDATSMASSDSQATAADPPGPTQPHLVDQLLDTANMSRREQLQQRKASIIRDFQRAAGDVGSPEVQVALLTEKIRDMADHFLSHKKDHSSRRGLQGMLNQRRKLLSYLRQANFARYAIVIHKLGLKDTFAKQARYDKYRVGTRLGAPAEPLKRYGNK